MATRRNVTTSPFTTRASSYEAPVEGIVDYGAFDRGLQKGLAVGLAIEEEKDPEVELDLKVKQFTGQNKNEMTGDQDLKTNNLFEVNAKEAMSRFRKPYIDAVKAKDKQTQDEILQSVANAKKSYSNLNNYVERIADNEINDGRVSDTNFIDENGNKIAFNGVDFTNINNKTPQNIRQGAKRDSNGVLKQGFYVLKDGKQYFLNTQDMDEAYLDRNFEVRDNLQGSINNSMNSKDGITNKFNRTPQYNTSQSTTIKITEEDGTVTEIKDSGSGKYIREEFYDKAKTNASTFASDKYKGANDAVYESAFRTLLDDDDFVSVLNGQQITPEQRAEGSFTDEEKVEMLKDYAAEKWKISIADAGYIKGENGRALERNTVAYRQDRSRKEKPIDESGSGNTYITQVVEDLNTQFNKRTSSAEQEFMKDKYEDGQVITGKDAPQTFNFLTNKSYTKGGSNKSIDNIEYRIVGDGDDRKIFLDVYHRSGNTEDLLKTVDLSDSTARNDFLTNVGRGLVETTDQKTAVRLETKALTESRKQAFKVFEDLSIGDKNSSRWNVLAKAIRNKSSEGLNLKSDEQEVFNDWLKGQTKQSDLNPN